MELNNKITLLNPIMQQKKRVQQLDAFCILMFIKRISL